MKAQNPKKKEKERNNNNKKEEEDLDLVRPEDMQQDEHQGPRTLMCHFECWRRGPWLTYQFMKLRRIMKAQNPKKKEKERNNNKKKKRRGPRLGQVRGYAAR